MAQDQQGFGINQVVCPNCGRSNPENAQFCAGCGQPVQGTHRLCSNCGSQLQPDDRFCPVCGAASRVTVAGAGAVGRAVPVETEYMGFWIRVAAALIDAVLTGVAGAIITAVTGTPYITSVLSIAYYVLLTGLKGQTLGKMALGIKVVNAQGDVPGIGRAALREIVGKFVSAIVILLGYFWIGWDREKRGWHDHISGTYVVRAPGR